MSTTPQAFYLRLNNHQGFMTGALAELYSNESMVDVTLTAEGQMIRAHKVVLSACSPYFKHIFLQFHNSTHYPIIIIKDMPFADLKAIVEFIYNGEITIPREQLESILTNGAILQIKGLSDVNKKKSTDGDNESIVHKDSENKSRKQSRKRSTINSRANNGENCANYEEISLLDDTNDGLFTNEVDTHENIKFIKKKFPNNETGNKKMIEKSENIPSLITNDNKTENTMTAETDNIVPFNLLEQSMRIHVKQDVNINPDNNLQNNQVNNDSTTTDHDKYEDDIETNNEDISDDIPLAIMTGNTVTAAEVEAKGETSCSSIKMFRPTKLRVSKAGIPRKGTSIRSQRKYKCPVCHKIYVSPQNMKEHLRNTHTNPNDKYACNTCGKEYSWKHALDRHFKSKHIKK